MRNPSPFSGPDRVPTSQRSAGLESHPVLHMRLSQYEKDGCPIEVAVPGLLSTIWFVPDEDRAQGLVGTGVGRGRIWTAAELRVIAATPQADQDELLTVARVKARFDGEILDVRELADRDPEDPPPPTISQCRSCAGSRFWRSIHGAVVCGECHPPAAESLVAEWIEAPGPEATEGRP